MNSAVVAPISYADYLDYEDRSGVRHEYVAGHLYAMSGGSVNHNEIALSIALALKARLPRPPCRVFVNDVKLQVREVDSVFYPDVVVTCDTVVRGNSVLISDACLVVEVASDSSYTTDHREKRIAYQRLPGLQSYWVVSQDDQEADVYARQPDGRWLRSTLRDPAATMPLPGDATPPLTLAELYAGTDLA